jgi:hypothetical protein
MQHASQVWYPRTSRRLHTFPLHPNHVGDGLLGLVYAIQAGLLSTRVRVARGFVEGASSLFIFPRS